MIEAAELAAFAPAATKFLEGLNEGCSRFGIITRQQLAMFMGQIAHESGNFTAKVESLNYSVEALRSKFSRIRISDAACQMYGRSTEHPADQRAIANAIYGGDWGRHSLGNVNADDGWNFRARGLIGQTGRRNYAACSQALFGDDRLLTSPDILEQPNESALSACWFWHANKLGAIADTGNVLSLSKAINLGSPDAKGTPNGLPDREEKTKRALIIWSAT